MQCIGDPILQPKSASTFRLISQNVNGFPSGNSSFDKLASTLHILDTFQCDLACIQEHNLDTTKFDVSQDIYQVTQRIFPSAPPTLLFNSSTVKTETRYKPGGTAMVNYTCNHRRTSTIFTDPLGRWTGYEFRRSNNRLLVVLSVYQTCVKPTNSVGITAHHQQETLLSEAGRSETPRQAFLADLIDLVSDLQATGSSVILVGDFNASVTAQNSPLHHLIAQTNLADIWSLYHPSVPEFGTHAQGSRRIDHLFLSQDLVGSVLRCGYLPFQEIVDSDHCALYVDIDITQLFGHTPQHPLASYTERSVRSHDKQAVLTFLSQTYSHMLSHNIFQRTATLATASGDTVGPLIEELDSRITEAFLTGIRKAKKRRPEWFSLPLVQQRLKVSALRNHLRNLKRDKSMSPGLIRRLELLSIKVPLPASTSATRQLLEIEISQLNQMQKDSRSLRETELLTKIHNAEILDSKDLAKAIRAIKRAEERHSTYRIVKRIRGKQTSSTDFNRLDIPADWPSPSDLSKAQSAGTLSDPKSIENQPHLWRTVTNPEEIQQYLTFRNQLHFGQARHTPLPAMETQLDWSASSDFATSVLDGTAPLNTQDTLTEILRECKQSITPDCTHPYITYDAFRAKILKWKESTTTSPSGRHLGCFKALFLPISTSSLTSSAPDENSSQRPASPLNTVISKRPESVSFEQQQRAIVDSIIQIMNACIQFCHPLDRWLTIINTMIYKSPGNHQVHRLRIIHIYESDFNFILATQWRHAIWRALSHPDLYDGQFGGRPGCQSTSLSLLEELQYDVSRLTRRLLIQFSNDAASCYDRIVIALASLINKKFGIPPDIVHLHATTLKNARFHVRTTAGVSKTHYSHHPEFPIFGSGQGSGNSPAIWLFISAVLLQVHSRLASGATFVSPDKQTAVTTTMTGFVDDTNSYVSPFDPQLQLPLSLAIDQMQSDAQLWNDLLHCSGGKLEISKCSYVILAFEFQSDGTPFLTFRPHHRPIHIIDRVTQETVAVSHMPHRGHHKTLGHMKSPSDEQKAQFRALLHKAIQLSLDIARSPITRYGAWVSYTTIFIPSVSFVLPQSYLSLSQLQSLESKTMEVLFAKCGYLRKTCRSILYSPSEFGGGGFIRFATLQGVGQVLMFLMHWRTDTIVSKMLRIDLSWSQFQAGLARPILADTRTPLPHLECRWLASLRLFLGKIGGSFRLDDFALPPSSRVNDAAIMQCAIEWQLFSPRQLKLFNYCRLYTHTYHISELFLADGVTICPYASDCSRPPWFDPALPITIQQRPNALTIRRTWLKFLSILRHRHPHYSSVPSLGPWLVGADKLRLRRETYQSVNDPDQVIHWYKDRYWVYTRSAQHRHRFLRHTSQSLPSLSGWFPAQVSPASNQSGLRLVTDTVMIYRSPPSVRPSPFFEDRIRTLPDWQQTLLHNFTIHPEFYQISDSTVLFPNDTLFVVSDGSVRDDGYMTYGWVYGYSNGLRLAEGYGQAFGRPSSHRAEAYGILSAAVFLSNTFQFLQLTKPLLPHIIISDNESLINTLIARRGYNDPFPTSTLTSDWDVTETAHMVHQTLYALTTSNYRWIRGHQDRTVEYSSLPVDAQMNVDADSLTHTPLSLSPLHSVHFLPTAKALFCLNSIPLTGNYVRDLQTHMAAFDFRAYLSSKLLLSTEDQDDLDTSLLSQLVRKLDVPHPQKVKLIFDLLPTRHHCRKFKLGSSLCHHCQTSPETLLHLIQCSNTIATDFRSTVLSHIRKYLSTVPLSPMLVDLLLSVYDDLFHNRPVLATTLLDDRVRCAALHQARIGWYPFIRGFISLRFSRLFLFQSSDSNGVQSALSSVMVYVWQQLLAFWSKHLDLVHQSSTSARSPAFRAELELQITVLYENQSQVLAQDQHRLFPPDLESFLATSSTLVLTNYLRVYKPAIVRSCKEARRIATYRTPRLTQFGFTANPHRSLTSPRVARFPHRTSRWKQVVASKASHQTTLPFLSH